MINALKNMFRRRTPLELASKEMVDAELSKLEAQSAQEYAAAIAAYNAARVKRLREYIQQHTEEAKL